MAWIGKAPGYCPRQTGTPGPDFRDRLTRVALPPSATWTSDDGPPAKVILTFPEPQAITSSSQMAISPEGMRTL